MLPDHVMLYIAALFPIFSFVAGFFLYVWTKRSWIPALLVLAVTLAALLIWFTMDFWSWLLLYLFLSWFGSWAAYHYLKRSQAE